MFTRTVRDRYCIVALVAVSHLEEIARRYLDEFFRDANLPVPKFKIVNHTAAQWLGRTTYRGDQPGNTTIEIQKSILGDEKTLDRVLAHEVIHHWEFLTQFGSETEKAKLKLGIRPPSHGKTFLDAADRINAVKGKDFVTTKSNESYVRQIEKDFYLLIMPSPTYKGKFGWVWTVRPSAEQKEVIRDKIANLSAKLVKSRDERFLGGAKIKRFGGISIPTDKETQEKLQELYEHGKDASHEVL